MDRAWIVAVVLCLSACGPQPASEGARAKPTDVHTATSDRSRQAVPHPHAFGLLKMASALSREDPR
jgi:hypothetical protein